MSCSQLSSKPLNNEGGELSKEEGDAEENTHTRQNKVDEEEPETPMDSEAWRRKNCGECLQMVWAPFFCLPFLAQYAATNTINGKLHGRGLRIYGEYFFLPEIPLIYIVIYRTLIHKNTANHVFLLAPPSKVR